MNIPSSTQFPVPSFQNADLDDASPKQFLAFLRNLVIQDLNGDPSIRIPASGRAGWVTVITELSDHFLASFPSSNVVPWNAMHDKLELIEITLEIIQRVTARVDALYSGPGDAAKHLFARLLSLCSSLDFWIDFGVTVEAGIPTPQHLSEKTFSVAVDLLRCLGGNVMAGGCNDEPTWKILRNILIECLDVSQGKWLRFSDLTMLILDRLRVPARSSKASLHRDNLQ